MHPTSCATFSPGLPPGFLSLFSLFFPSIPREPALLPVDSPLTSQSCRRPSRPPTPPERIDTSLKCYKHLCKHGTKVHLLRQYLPGSRFLQRRRCLSLGSSEQKRRAAILISLLAFVVILIFSLFRSSQTVFYPTKVRNKQTGRCGFIGGQTLPTTVGKLRPMGRVWPTDQFNPAPTQPKMKKVASLIG